MYFHYINDKTKILKTSKKEDKYYRKLIMGVRRSATSVPVYIYKQDGIFEESLKIMTYQDFILRCLDNDIQFVLLIKC